MSDEVRTVALGGERNGVVIHVLGREAPGSLDFWDGNWVRTHFIVTSGGLTADLYASMRLDEFSDFAGQVASMDKSHSGSATFETVERWLSLGIRCSGAGQLEITGTARDPDARGNSLGFAINGLDQTHLGPLSADLASVIERYPVVGQP